MKQLKEKAKFTMREPLFQSSIDEILSKRAIPPELLQDLHKIAGLTEIECLRIASGIEAMEGVASTESLTSTISEVLNGKDASVIESVYRALTGLRADGVEQLASSVRQWVMANDARNAVFSERHLQNLSRNLGILVNEYRAIWLMLKADKLLRAVGNEIQDVKFVCDLRPVFDPNRENVEAFVLVANLRLVYQGQDGNLKSCEIALTEDELNMLHEKTAEACKKITVLNNIRSSLSVSLGENGGEQ